MSECGESETVSLANSSQFRVKYGSTSRHVSNTSERIISHSVQPTDTLQGLALKYQVTMEQIKRANKLWSSDNLTLRSRQELLIPIPIEGHTSPLYSSSTEESSGGIRDSDRRSPGDHSDNTHGNSSLECDEIALDGVDGSPPPVMNGHRTGTSAKTKVSSPLVSSSQHPANNDSKSSDDESAADFLIRIDSSIAVSKDKVKKHMHHDNSSNFLSGTQSDDDLFRYNHHPSNSGLRRHNSNSSSRSHSTHNCSINVDFHNADNGQPYVVMTQGRKVKSSLKRLEKTQDELFEL